MNMLRDYKNKKNSNILMSCDFCEEQTPLIGMGY